MYTITATVPYRNRRDPGRCDDREPNRGLLWQPITMEHLNDFELAVDVALLAQRRSDMQRHLDDLANRFSAAGLTINVEYVESFQYIGSKMAADDGTKIDIGARIKEARAAFVGAAGTKVLGPDAPPRLRVSRVVAG